MEELDDPEAVASVDRGGMSRFLEENPAHYKQALEIGEQAELGSLEKADGFEKILFLGMGGSSIGGSLIKDWAYDRLPVPVEVWRDSTLPRYADEKTLIVAISYSGNTLETLTSFSEAVKRGCPTLALSSGGFLREQCRESGLPHVKVPKGLQPRQALPYLMVPPAVVLERLRLLDGVKAEVAEAVKVMEAMAGSLKVSTPTEKNPAKALAVELKGTLPTVYGFREYASVAYRVKTQLNENSKMLSRFELFPEANHNEVQGWERLSPQLASMLSVLLLRDREEPPDMRARIEAAKSLFTRKIPRVHELYGEGSSRMAKMLSLIYLGDYLSLYLAVLNQVDPTPVESITALKKDVEQRLYPQRDPP
ncbi:bifunctional phosphoglucose/phosphomannose isomerase [Candidatus Hecatella orcuttiae]|uniref:bifunctional phosphoglucose/phosphomannose isomerase n=1 Tax=Candidatus Hecatella orcuttiae TaxID=1935119 RepID=UPI00286805DE|nr:bifunctional phosphoglucose/phosphomannose isomerase [Candidatus Hecatella orcuttiae]